MGPARPGATPGAALMSASLRWLGWGRLAPLCAGSFICSIGGPLLTMLVGRRPEVCGHSVMIAWALRGPSFCWATLVLIDDLCAHVIAHGILNASGHLRYAGIVSALLTEGTPMSIPKPCVRYF